MKIITLLVKVKAKSVSPYALLDSSSFLCMLSLKSLMEQLQVRQGGTAVGNNMYYWYTYTAIHGVNECICLRHYLSYTLTLQPNIKIMYVYPYFQTLKTTLLVQEGST